MSTNTISPVNISTTSKTLIIIATEELVFGEAVTDDEAVTDNEASVTDDEFKTAVEIPRLKISMILCKITYFHSD